MGFGLNSSMKKASNAQPHIYLRLLRNKVSWTLRELLYYSTAMPVKRAGERRVELNCHIVHQVYMPFLL